MVQAVWFDAGAERAGRLLLTIHHLAVDGVSWRILVPDLAAAWAACERRGSRRCRRAGTSFRRWAQRLAAEAQDAARVGELAFWRGMLASRRGRSSRARSTGTRHRRQRPALTLDAAGAVTGRC